MRVGVVSDLRFEQYGSYYFAAKNVFEDVQLIQSHKDLEGLDAILCGNDHHQGHRDIWEQDEFINEANRLWLPFFAHTVEHIHSPNFPWNLKIQHSLEKFYKLRQRCWDVDDAKRYKTKLARVLISKRYLEDFEPPASRKDKAIFIGKIYPNREKVIREMQKFMEVDVGARQDISYRQFLSILASYRFVFSPLSLSSTGIPGRFYEALAVGSFPIQEVAPNTLEAYQTEASFRDAIFFQTAEEAVEKIKKFNLAKTENKMCLESELTEFFHDHR